MKVKPGNEIPSWRVLLVYVDFHALLSSRQCSYAGLLLSLIGALCICFEISQGSVWRNYYLIL